MQIRVHRKGNNESWGGRVLVDAGGDEKQGIYFAWPYNIKNWHALFSPVCFTTQITICHTQDHTIEWEQDAHVSKV